MFCDPQHTHFATQKHASSIESYYPVIKMGIGKGGSPQKKATRDIEAQIQHAFSAHLQANKTRNGIVSTRKTSRRHGVDRMTITRRIQGGRSHAEAMRRRQRLSPEEENELVEWSRQLEEWGWPARISQLEKMAKDMLVLKGDMENLGKNWTAKWLKRHPEMKSKFVPPLDKSRAMAQNAGTIGRYFLLQDQIIQDQEIQLCDIYNMDEKGCMMGIIGENRVIVTKDER